MSAVVWKFGVPMPKQDGHSYIDMPEASELLSVGIQGDEMVVWALVRRPEPFQTRCLLVANTGVPLYETLNTPLSWGQRFLGTVTNRDVVWHVWDGGAA